MNAEATERAVLWTVFNLWKQIMKLQVIKREQQMTSVFLSWSNPQSVISLLLCVYIYLPSIRFRKFITNTYS